MRHAVVEFVDEGGVVCGLEERLGKGRLDGQWRRPVGTVMLAHVALVAVDQQPGTENVLGGSFLRVGPPRPKRL